MFYRFKDFLNRIFFNVSVRKILCTPPLYPSRKGKKIIFLSMVSHKDLFMYLVAIKSLYSFFRLGEIVLLNDGSLTENDLELISRHLPIYEVHNISDVDVGLCPRGGTWERLVLISFYVDRGFYVIQLDSDTLTINNCQEVINSCCNNRPFVLRGEKTAEIRTLYDISLSAKEKLQNRNFVQLVFESAFQDLINYPIRQVKYIRGCSGFAGFPPYSFTFSDLEKFSVAMENIVGSLWHSWGSEQVCSNFVLANMSDLFLLPWHKYRHYDGQLSNFEDVSFLHFIGTHRFKKGVYRKLANKVIKTLLIH